MLHGGKRGDTRVLDSRGGDHLPPRPGRSRVRTARRVVHRDTPGRGLGRGDLRTVRRRGRADDSVRGRPAGPPGASASCAGTGSVVRLPTLGTTPDGGRCVMTHQHEVAR